MSGVEWSLRVCDPVGRMDVSNSLGHFSVLIITSLCRGRDKLSIFTWGLVVSYSVVTVGRV